MTLRRKIHWLTWIGLIGCMMAAIPALYLLHRGLTDERQRLAEATVASARGVLADFHAAVDGKDLDPAVRARAMDEVRTRAMMALGALSKGPLHVSVFTDGPPPPGWAGADHTITAVADFAPWGWTVAAAASTRDLDREFLSHVLAFFVFLLALLLLSWPLSAFLTQQVVDPIEALSGRMRQLTEGRLDVDVPCRDRSDEFGTMAEAMEYFRSTAAGILERDERLSGIMSNVGEAIVLVAEEGTVEEVNPAAERLFGLPAAGLVGRSFLDLFVEADRPRVAVLLAEHAGEPVEAPGGTEEGVAVDRAGRRIEVSVVLSRMEVLGRFSFICVMTDVTQRLEYERELLRLATRDRLTGLPNRALIESLLDSAIQRHRRNGSRFALMGMELVRFKLVTDTLGHQAGDALVLEVARRAQNVVRASDAVGRVGIDQFAIILDDVGSEDGAATVAQRLLAAFDTPVDLLGTDYYVRPALGIALFPDHAASAMELLRAADTAVRAAHRAGGRRHAVFCRQFDEQARRHLALDRDLRIGLRERQFRLYYQPKVSMYDLRLEGFEALLRWEKPGQGMVPPGDFIPLAEETGIIVQLGDWVLDEACRQQREWQEAGLDPVPVAVNVSPRQLRQRSAEEFRRIIERHRLPSSLIELEITEGAVMQDLDHALAVLGDLKAMGVAVAVDDFGTGHSSLSYLKRLPVSTLKIDRSFVNGVPHEREDAGIVTTIIAMAEMLGLSVVAEGVERPEQVGFLRHHNCRYIQGYLTGRPMPAADAAELLGQRQKQSA